MGIGDFFSGIKGKVTESVMEKAIENMRDMKAPVKEGTVNDFIEECNIAIPIQAGRTPKAARSESESI